MVDFIKEKVSDAEKEKIKEIVRFHYGFTPIDEDIYRIDQGLKNNYVTLHRERIMSEIVTWKINEILLKHRTKENVLEIESLFLNKLIFRYLSYASMCYRASIPIATIYLCRTALEAGLRERIAEERAKRKMCKNEEFGKEVWKEIVKLKKDTLRSLIPKAEKVGIIKEAEIEEIYKLDVRGKTILHKHRHLLDKYIHADLPTLVDFLESIGINEEIVGTKNMLKKMKIKAEVWIDKMAVIALAATTRLAERLYLE